MADKSKRSFEFRMSKKVAELTQVVHMLFTRNHEKEVEVDAMKESYEFEIKQVIEDGKNKIVHLENKVHELERKLERERNTQKDKIETQVVIQTGDKEEEWKRRVSVAEKALQEEKLETQHMRDLLINAQKDIEKLRQKLEETMDFKSDEIDRKDREIDRMRKQCSEMERTFSDSERQSRDTISSLEKANNKLSDEFLEMQDLLEETHRIKEQLVTRVKQLEAELRALKKDFQKKVSEVVQQNHVVKVPRSATAPSNSFPEYSDELERMRAEVRRYRLELHNRDSNFNRMFTDQSPLIVDPKAGRIGVNSSQVIHQSLPTSHTQVSALSIHGRERSFSYALVQGYEETKRPGSRVSSAASGKLPSLTPEQRARLTKLMKPRPLPKEMLYSK